MNRLEMNQNRFSLDIETVSTVADPEFDVPEHWLPFAIALGHQSPAMNYPDVIVTFRDDPSLAAEHRMLSNCIDWIADRVERDTERVLLTYNGDGYDIPILQHRAKELDSEIESNLSNRLQLLLNGSRHVDLILEMKEREGYWVSLDDALSMHDIEYDHVEWLGREVTGKDMPSFGLELMTDRPDDDLREVTRRYAASDVRPLFRLHEKLEYETVNRPGRHHAE